MNNPLKNGRPDLWRWMEFLLGIAVLAGAFVFTAQTRSPAHSVAQFLALMALFALTLASYRPEQRKLFARGARAIGILCSLVALMLLLLT